MKRDAIELLKGRLREFAKERDWDQFHSPKNLSMALIAEAAELIEHFQWLTLYQSSNLPADKLKEVEQELAGSEWGWASIRSKTNDKAEGLSSLE